MRFEKDPEKILAALNNGFITPQDYQLWMGCQGYKNALKKSFECEKISKATFVAENNNADNVYFERDSKAGSGLKFVLQGAKDFQPLDLTETKVISKAQEEKPLQNVSSAIKKASSIGEINMRIDNILDDCKKLTKATDEQTAILKRRLGI